MVDGLAAVQGERFAEATVLVADAVSGNEEIPEGVTAVITLDTPDLLSHVAVRARNAQVLFATCFEPAAYEHLKGLADRTISLHGHALAATWTTRRRTKADRMKDEKEHPSPV